jgi:xylulokinase
MDGGGEVGGEITVGLDIGTTSVKAVAVNADGEVVARARIPHTAHSPTAEIFEHDAREAWVDGPRAALAALDVSDVAGVGIAAMMPSFTAVDSDGMPLTPGLLYGDHRGRSESDVPDPLNSGESRAMLQWTAQAAPDAHGYWTAATVAGAAIGGAPIIDMGTAVALSPLWNGEWDADGLAEIGVSAEQLPPVVAPGEAAGTIGSAVQVAGVADAWAEATVAGANQAGDTLVICGTTLIVWCMVAERGEVPGMWSLPHPLGEVQMLAGASNAGGMFVNWARRTIAADGSPPAPGGVPIWVPYLRGERTPLNDATLRASLHDLDLGQEPSALVRAAYEATGFVARRMIDLASPGTSRIIVSGGGLYDDQWMQALADCTGLPVDVVAVPEGAALGAAWYARVGAGLDKLEAATRWVRFGQRYEPDPDWAGPCRERYERWRELAAAPNS